MGPYNFGMPAWLGDGEIYCEDCKDETCDGPYPEGGGENDRPSHCAGCGLFLENPLTDEGDEWLVDAYEQAKLAGSGIYEPLATWVAFYDYLDLTEE